MASASREKPAGNGRHAHRRQGAHPRGRVARKNRFVVITAAGRPARSSCAPLRGIEQWIKRNAKRRKRRKRKREKFLAPYRKDPPVAEMLKQSGKIMLLPGPYTASRSAMVNAIMDRAMEKYEAVILMGDY